MCRIIYIKTIYRYYKILIYKKSVKCKTDGMSEVAKCCGGKAKRQDKGFVEF